MWCYNRNNFICLIILFFAFSCKEKKGYDSDTYKINLIRISDTLNLIQADIYKKGKLTSTSTWKLNYPLYQFDIGDITNDSIPEIAVGVIKTTRYDHNPGKRLFLFRITENGYIRPLWLGSRVSQPLEDFTLTKEHPAKIQTIEKEQSGNFLVASYCWHGFGLEFREYIQREISKAEAETLLYK